MPIKDLLWACPLCHRLEGIAADGRCSACGTVFSRGRGARICASAAGRTLDELPPVDWLARLPWPELDGEGRSLPPGAGPPLSQPVRVRFGMADQPLRRGRDLLGYIERFGPETDGVVTLDDRHLTITPTNAQPRAWPLHLLTAIQPASSSIQVKARHEPVASLRFPAGSLRLWEQRMLYCVREAYRAAGKGDVFEFQPHIRAR